MKLDFHGLNSFLIPRATTILSSWLPGGKITGNEFKCGDISGSPGDSFSVNLTTGKWADFATGEKGGDLISLYGAQRNLDPGDAYKALATDHGFTGVGPQPLRIEGKSASELGIPPVGFAPPITNHDRYGVPSDVYEYKGPNDETLHYIAKYVEADGKKQFVPYSWSKTSGWWVKKAWPKPRPLFNLNELAQNPQKPVMIVEGEKCVLAAKAIQGSPYVVTTWSGGAQAWKQADWEPIQNREVIIWPDNDQPGITAAGQIAAMLVTKNKSVKIIDPSGLDEKCDVADLGFNTIAELIEWARPRVKKIEPPAVRPEVLPPEEQRRSITTEKPKNNLHCELEGFGSFSQLYRELGIQTTGENENPVSNVANAMILLFGYSEFQGKFWYDKFHNAFFTTWRQSEPTKWNDQMTTKLQARLQIGFGLKTLSPSMAESAMAATGSEVIKSEPNEWLESITQWDGEPRINESFFVHFGVVPSAYQEAVSKNFWISMVARILSPGCKVDTMVILEGNQGAFKSTALSIIGGKFYTQNNEQVTNKDFKLVLRGSFLIEIAELESFSKADATKIKSILSDAHDNFRVPYGKLAEKFPRQSIFVGSTNADEYLSDETGARRFWPVKTGEVHSINLGQLVEDRDQLFAEAVYRFKNGESWWEVPKAEAKAQQDERYQEDAWEIAVSQYIDSIEVKHKDYIYITHLLQYGIKMDLDKIDRRAQLRASKILKRFGWSKRSLRLGESKVTSAWFRPPTLGVQTSMENSNDNGSQE